MPLNMTKDEAISKTYLVRNNSGNLSIGLENVEQSSGTLESYHRASCTQAVGVGHGLNGAVADRDDHPSDEHDYRHDCSGGLVGGTSFSPVGVVARDR